MYSPYIDKKKKNEYDDIDLASCTDEVRYDLSYGKKQCKRTYRYLIECEEKESGKKFIFG